MRKIGVTLAFVAVISGSVATAQTATAAQNSHDTNVYIQPAAPGETTFKCSTARAGPARWAAVPAGSGAMAGVGGAVTPANDDAPANDDRLETAVMKARTMAGGVALAAAMTAGGCGYAAAAGDLSSLPVDPNVVTDSLAYSAAPPVFNPNGQPGVQTVYTHRDGSRQITTTILTLSDPQAAKGALDAAGGELTSKVANGKSQPVPVGTGGTMLGGKSPDGSKSVTILSFTEGNAAATIEFDGAPKDPAPSDVVLDLGNKQDLAIRAWQAG